MKKIKLIVLFIAIMLSSMVISVYAATYITASEVSYTSNSQSTVDGALNNLYTRANGLAYYVTELKKHGCFNYSGTTNSSGELTVTHNKNISSYYPMVSTGETTTALVIYNVRDVSANSFKVQFAKVDNFVLANPGAVSAKINWCY